MDLKKKILTIKRNKWLQVIYIWVENGNTGILPKEPSTLLVNTAWHPIVRQSGLLSMQIMTPHSHPTLKNLQGLLIFWNSHNSCPELTRFSKIEPQPAFSSTPDPLPFAHEATTKQLPTGPRTHQAPPYLRSFELIGPSLYEVPGVPNSYLSSRTHLQYHLLEQTFPDHLISRNLTHTHPSTPHYFLI